MIERNFENIRSNYINSKAKRAQFRYFHEKMISFSKEKNQSIILGDEIEIGCGVTPMKDNFPHIISSDIEENSFTDMVIDAINLPFNDESLMTIYATNCFHHISDKRKFIDECFRVLKGNGKLILLEPSFSLLSLIIYPFLFKSESYNIFSSIKKLDTFDSMQGANQAASFICFNRSKKKFLKNSGLIITNIFHCRNSIAYILSGGINFKQLISFEFIKKVMNISFFPFLISLHWIIVLKKKVN